MFGCVLENTIENTFSTCCSHFLTFSRLPNEYIIHSFLKTQTKPKKKSSNLDTSCDRDRRGRRFARSAWSALRAIGVFGTSRDRDRRIARLRSTHRAIAIARRISASSALDDLYSLFFLSPSLSLSLSLLFSYFVQILQE